MLLAVLAGSGIQLFLMIALLIAFSLIGFSAREQRSNLINSGLVLFIFTSQLAGYIASRLYKMFGGKHWKKAILLSALGFPGVAFVVFFSVNLMLWMEESSAAVPFLNILVLLFMWLGCSLPLTCLGFYLGHKRDVVRNPCKPTNIPRPIPPQSFYVRSKFALLVGGLLPFGVTFIELNFIMASVWGSHIYYLFGFLIAVFLIMVIISAEVSIVLCYFMINAENHHWWWRSFLTSGFSGVYFFLYAVVYFIRDMPKTTRFTAGALYFGYMALSASAFFLLNGAIGFLSTFFFMRKIYSYIRSD